MTARLHVERTGPALGLQDAGRPGHLAVGLSRGGALDRLALAEGAALLGQGVEAAIGMAVSGGEFRAEGELRIALTGAPMRAALDGVPLAWNASHAVADGQRLSIGSAERGLYGYLHVGGGFDTERVLGSRSAHLAAGLGEAVVAGRALPVGRDAGAGGRPVTLDVDDRFRGGTVRVLPSVHTALFADAVRERFEGTVFHRSPRGNRQGAELLFDGHPFQVVGQGSIPSEPMLPGDIQMTGEGRPYVLLSECQTTGGYPRIAQVLPDDLAIVAQATPDRAIRFVFTTHEEGLAAHRSDAALAPALRARLRPLIRRPEEVGDLLSFELVSGVTAGHDEEGREGRAIGRPTDGRSAARRAVPAQDLRPTGVPARAGNSRTGAR